MMSSLTQQSQQPAPATTRSLMAALLMLLLTATCLTSTAQHLGLVADLNKLGTSGSTPSAYVEWNGILYYIATTQEYGTELWQWDGTTWTALGSNGPNSASIHCFRKVSFSTKRSPILVVQ